MKVLIINISLRPDSEKILFPIGIGYIATAIKNAGFDLEILDLDVLHWSDKKIGEFIRDSSFDVVAMGCLVTGYRYVKKYCEMIKRHKNVPIIVGNSVAASIPKILMKKTKADIGVMGEGDITIVELLKAIENNTSLLDVKGIFFKQGNDVTFTKPRDVIKDLDTLPFIDYSLFNMDVYLKYGKYNAHEPYPIPFEQLICMPVNTARGCVNNCTFCYHVFKDEKYRYRSAKNIVEEIKLLKRKYGVNYIHFFDELSLFSKKRVDEIADCFINNNLNVFWVADCCAGLLKENDIDLALKLKKSGCVALGFSLESSNPEILRAMNKHISVDDWIVQTHVLQKAGINVATSLVIGYPSETLDTIKDTFDTCYNCNVYPSAGYLLPQPCTPMYDYALDKKLIVDEEKYLLSIADRQDFYINFTNESQRDIEQSVASNLSRINKKLDIGLNNKQLIKTGHFRGRAKN